MTDALLFNLFALTMISCRIWVIEGQAITPVYVQSDAPITLTCPDDVQATTLTWTGPGGILYVMGTTVEAGLDGRVKPRISARHTGGSYKLTFTEFQPSDTGIYTCTVDGTVDLQMVIVQGVTSASPVYTRLEGTVTLQCPDTETIKRAQWYVTSITLLYTIGTEISPNIPGDTRTRLSVTRQDGTYNLQISDIQLSDVRGYRCIIGGTETFYHLLLYIPPAFPEIEKTVNADGQNRTTGTEDGSMTLTCNSRGGIPAARVSWIKDGTTLVTSDNTVQHTKVFTRADDRTVYTCQSYSPALPSPQTTSVLVYLDLKPGQPTISDQLSQTENTNIQVVCVSIGSRPAAIIQWNVGGIWQSKHPTEITVKDTATDTYTVTSTLSLPVTRQDNGKYVYCRASNQALSGGIESVRHSIIVLFGPDSVIITGNRVVVADGTNTLPLTCTAQEFSRHVHITWYNGTTQIPNTAGVTNTSGTYGGSVSTQVLHLTPDRYQDGNMIKCVVQNEDVTLGEKTASVTLNINYPPSTPVSVSVNPTTEGRENTAVDLTCHVTGGKPMPSLQWTCPASVSKTAPITGSQGDRHTSVITVTLTRQANGKRCNCIGSQTDTTWTGSDQSPVFAVRFGPDSASIIGNRVVVADGTSTNTLTLTCTTQEYNRHVHIKWYNGTTQISNTAVVTNTSRTYGGYISTQVLQLTPDRYADGNVIKCVVQNVDVTLGERTASVTLNINYPPSTSVSVSVNPTTEGGENTAVDLTCHVTGGKPTPILQWMCPESVSKTAPITGSQESQGDSHTSVITVTLTRQANGQRCNCIGNQTNTTWTGSDQSPVFAVRFGPDSVSITGDRVVVADGTNTLTLTCTTQEYNRHVHITWFNGTTRILNTVGVTNTSGTYGGYISTQVLQLTPDRYQNGNVIKCAVQNEDVALGEKTASVTLRINYRPYLNLTPTPGMNVIEGGELEIRCDVDSNPSPSSITWSRVGQLPSNSDVTSGVIRIPSTHRTDRGTYQCTALNSVSREQESINIDIYYPPDIQVTYTNTTFTSLDRVLTCVPDGNPDTYQFGEWRHTAEDGTEIRQLTGSSNSLQSVLTLPDPGVTRRYEDTGYYICKVSNSIPVPSSYRSSSVFLVVEAPPVVIANTTVVKGQIGDNATMEVEFYSRPAVSSSDVFWTRGTDGLRPLNKSVTSVDTRSIQISFHGVDIKVKGYVAVIKLHNLVEQDFGNYTVTMENSIGMNNFTIWFKSASPPLPPEHLVSLTYDSSSITVEWTPSFNGGAEQEFVIGYKSDISQDIVDLAPIPDKHELTQSYQITGLKPGTTHSIRIYSENEIGRSGDVFLNQTTAAAGEDEPSIGPLVGGIAGSALGLIAIAVVAVVIYKRRSTAKGDDMEMINSPNKVSADDDSDGLKPNILYESSDGLKANVLYESAGANFQPQPGPSSEYAIVCKPNKKNGAAVDPNSVYAVVEKSNKDKQDSNDVYAVVDKQPKEKGGKGKKKQPEQKQQKGGKKDKKKAGHGNAEKKKAGRGNDGDVYENVTSIPGQEEQLYANSTETAKHDQRPSRKRNQDGLVYLEVEFKDNGTGERRAVIHGIENRNDYVDIDFTKRADPLPDQDEHVEETDGEAKD